MDKRLEEQLERMRELSARVAQIHEQLAQNTELLTRDREQMSGSPLHDVRDLRTWSQPLPDEPAEVRHRSTRRSQAPDRPRGRRRRRR